MKDLKMSLKVLYHLKRSVVRANGLSPIMGRISIGKSKTEFSCKLESDPFLWNTQAGRMTGKSSLAISVNRQLDKINVSINTHYRELLVLKGTVTATEVKNAFQGIASTQETLLQMFRQHNEEYKMRIGINRTFRT